MSQPTTNLRSVNQLQATKAIVDEICSIQLPGKAGKSIYCEVDTIATDGNDDVSVPMTYQDNTVRLLFVSTYKLDDAVFTVTGLSITEGQDPKHKNKIGDVKLWSGERASIMWSVGRSKSTQVADFWKKSIKASENTFNHNPEDLNFAFLGEMDLTISGGVFTEPTLFTIGTEFDFGRVAIGQGSSGLTNNWWFGCNLGTNIGGYRIRCPAVSGSGQQLWLDFCRGGPSNAVNEIRLEDIRFSSPFQTMPLERKYVGESTRNTWQDAQLSPPYVTYYTSTQANTLKLHVKDGLLYDVNNVKFDTSEATVGESGVPAAIFILATDERTIYASRQHMKYMFHDSTILAGGNVFSAGEISVNRGAIQWMSNASGHYKPDAQVAYKQFKIALWNQGYENHFPLKAFDRAMLDLLDQ
ncbi:hypothetical protein F5B18DRAFT_675986 [Nemania serpens]|nr:hypothetical protein F5B18DRAFT_675986 [Nemania serpens]